MEEQILYICKKEIEKNVLDHLLIHLRIVTVRYLPTKGRKELMSFQKHTGQPYPWAVLEMAGQHCYKRRRIFRSHSVFHNNCDNAFSFNYKCPFPRDIDRVSKNLKGVPRFIFTRQHCSSDTHQQQQATERCCSAVLVRPVLLPRHS